jgi:hypothetical protein
MICNSELRRKFRIDVPIVPFKLILSSSVNLSDDSSFWKAFPHRPSRRAFMSLSKISVARTTLTTSWRNRLKSLSSLNIHFCKSLYVGSMRSCNTIVRIQKMNVRTKHLKMSQKTRILRLFRTSQDNSSEFCSATDLFL